jgi:hypothetical protein
MAAATKPKRSPRPRRTPRKHRVRASLNVVDLTKAGTSLELEVFADRQKIGTLLIGRGSVTWRGGRRQKEKRLSWTDFAQHMDTFVYDGSR